MGDTPLSGTSPGSAKSLSLVQVVERAASGIAVTVALAYFLGWIEANGYFAACGGLWLVAKEPTAEFLGTATLYALPIVVALVALLHPRIADLWDRARWLFVGAYGVVLLGSLLFLRGQRNREAMVLGALSVSLGVTLVVVITFVAIARRPSRKGVRASLGSGFLALSSATVLLVLPCAFGSMLGAMDCTLATTTLPLVTARMPSGSGAYLHALLMTESRIYALDLNQGSQRVDVLKWDDVISVQRTF